MKELNFKGKSIRYDIQGEGEPVFLVHGYLESLEIWESLAGKLADHYRVIRMDLPGHGKSEVIQDIHHMELLAESALAVLKKAGEERCTMIGHSLGGYVTLAFLELFPEKLNGFSLFHSHPFADSEQVRQNRQREINLVKEGKQQEIFKTNVPKLFADENLKALYREVEWAGRIAGSTPGEGIIANLKGMMERPDRSELVRSVEKPFLLIAGRKDKYINYQTVIPQIPLPKKGQLVTLENAGHLGFVEEENRSIQTIHDFMAQTGS